MTPLDQRVADVLAEVRRDWHRDKVVGAYHYAPVHDLVEDLLGTLARDDDAEDAALELPFKFKRPELEGPEDDDDA